MNRKLSLVIGSLAGLGVLAIAGFSLWYFVLREDGPAAVSTDDALQSLDKASPSAAASTASTPSNSATTAPTTGSGSGASTSINGSWTVDTSLGSFVGYRVKEELAGLGGVEAVGRTAKVTGTVTIAANKASAGTITADMTALKSQESLRDGTLRNQGIEFGKFPTSEFKLTGGVDVPTTVESGTTAKVTLTGTLTLHGVTKAVEVPAELTLKNGVLVVVGQIPIQFADYSISKPQSQKVVGMEDKGVMELQLFFKKS